MLLVPWAGNLLWGIPAAAALLYWKFSGAAFFPAVRRAAAALPFALLIFISNSLSGFSGAAPWGALLKSASVIFMTALLFCAVPFSEIVSFLKALRAPVVFISVFSFMYRYFFSLKDDISSKLKALKARSRRPPGRRELSSLASALLLRSFERADRVRAAMLARGWEA
ncbi:MAG: energy-coupling factor transporter transmembrane component T [Sulfurisoma sp.]|nr:energy-coupling factor transporter transmembrane component T [Sulfurisoma sp.]